jgi:endonuclease/exonuclease/phosphatase family metal-dependent hydrolase
MMIRLLNYNIKSGGHGREALILDILRQSQADIIVLQEVFDDTPLHAFAQTLDMNYYIAASNVKWHVALLSRFPISTALSHRQPPIFRGLLEATLAVGQQPLQVFGVHLYAGLAIGAELRRYRELAPILKQLAPYRARPCLIAGDFNTVTPGDRVVIETMPPWLRRLLWRQGRHVFRFVMRKFLRAGWIDCFRLLNAHDDGFTLPTGRPDIRIDYVFTSAALRPGVRLCRVLREPAALESASDHYPIIAEFDL